MREHRSTQSKVSKAAEDINFDAGTALENLRAEVVDIEALAPRRGSGRRGVAHAGDRSPARGVRPDPVAHHEGLGTGERVAPLRERAGHRAHRAGGGTPEGGGSLNGGAAAAPRGAVAAGWGARARS